MAKDNCVMCGTQTDYDFHTHIDYRYGYVEGVGQLCKNCYENNTVISNTQQENSQNPNIYDNNKV
jgi:hypothetical protein